MQSWCLVVCVAELPEQVLCRTRQALARWPWGSNRYLIAVDTQHRIRKSLASPPTPAVHMSGRDTASLSMDSVTHVRI